MRSGSSSATATANPDGRPPPASRHVAPASVEIASGGRRSTTATTVAPALAVATTRGRSTLGASTAGSSVPGPSTASSSTSTSTTPSTVSTAAITAAAPTRAPLRVARPSRERRDVHPLDAVEAELVLVPRISDDVDRHRPHAVAVIGERERRRLRADHQVERELERLQPAREVDCVPLAAFRDEPRVDSERAQRAGRVPGRAADARRAAGDHVTRELSDDGERHRRPI